MRYTRLMVLFVAAALPVALEAQIRPQGGRGRRGAQQGQPVGQDTARRDRAMLEGEIRQRLARQMQVRLGLTEAQMARVREINQRYADRRQMVMQQEREVRMALRDEMIGADSSRQQQVADLLDRIVRVQRQRIDLMEQEQRDLATVLTPLQRAAYMGFEEQVRQRMEQLRQGGGGRMGPPPDGALPGAPNPRFRPPGDTGRSRP